MGYFFEAVDLVAAPEGSAYHSYVRLLDVLLDVVG